MARRPNTRCCAKCAASGTTTTSSRPEARDQGRRGYYGLCSFLDDNIGQVLRALADSGQAEHTIVVYLSDHGEMLGNHGFWAKSVMYEDAVGDSL